MVKENITKELETINKEYSVLSTVFKCQTTSKGPLKDINFSLKDCICLKNVESHASSAILKGYKPVFNSTVAQKILDNGGTIVGKTVQDEFGFGGFSINVGKDMTVPKNPIDPERVCGGSSGGGAALASVAQHSHVAVIESTGGSIVDPACFCGVIGLCPTYGRISRYGVMDYASSMDKIGFAGKSVEDIALALEILAGKDTHDATTLPDAVPTYTKSITKSKQAVKKMKLAVIKECLKAATPEIQEKINSKIEELKKLGAEVDEISLPFTQKFALPTYYILALSEASTNLARYCGIRYGASEKLEGNFNEYFSKVRSKYFGDEAKRRIMLGTFTRMSGYRDAYYIKAAKVRTLIIAEYKKQFEKYDALISPTMPIIAPKFEDVEKLTPLEHYKMDILTVGPNVAGLPHITVPAGSIDKENKKEIKTPMPSGIMFIGDHLAEEKLLQLADVIKGK